MTEEQRPTPSSEETGAACLAHFLQLVTWWIGPLVIFLVKRESRFVAFHAVQALLLQIVYFAVFIGMFVVLFVGMFASIPQEESAQPPAEPPQKPQGPPPLFFLLFPLVWLVGMGGWVLSLVLGIVYGIKAMRGEWAAYPIIGRWARRLVGV